MSPSPTRRVARRSVTAVVGSAGAKLLGLGLTLFLARKLGSAAFGSYTTALAVSGVATFLSRAVSGSYISREVARSPDRARDLFGVAVRVNAAAGVAVAALVALWAASADYSPATRSAVHIALCGVPLEAVLNAGYATLYGRHRVGLAWSLALGHTALMAGLGAGVVLAGGDLSSLVTAVVGAKAVAAAVYLGVLHSVAGPSARTVPSLAAVRESLPFFLGTVSAILSAQMDVLVLSLLGSDVDVGRYGAAVTLVQGPLGLAAILASTAQPELARLWVQSREACAALFGRVLTTLALALAAVGIPMVLGARWIIVTVFGPEYEAAALALAILGAGLAVEGLVPLRIELLRCMDRPAPAARTVAAGGVLRLVLLLALIPRAGLVGVAIARVASMTLVHAVLRAQTARASQSR